MTKFVDRWLHQMSPRQWLIVVCAVLIRVLYQAHHSTTLFVVFGIAMCAAAAPIVAWAARAIACRFGR